MAVTLSAGCGGGGTAAAPTPATAAPATSAISPTPSPSAICTPSGTALEISAQADPSSSGPSPYSFDKDCLAAPADTRFTIRFDNRDAETHNVDILDFPGGTSLFTGKLVTGPKIVTYTVKPLPSGTYYFRCDIHPLRMHGTFVVGE
jgi:plastocyanin